MTFLTTILPATVIAAVVLFVVKEAMEALRRYKADSRKKDALRRLLARECERNHAVLRSLKEACSWLKEADDEDSPFTFRFRVHFTPAGHLRFVRHVGITESEGSFVLRPAQQELMGRLMVEVAALDAPLFDLLEHAYDAVAEMRHLRDSIIDHLSSDAEDKNEIFLLGFADYALGELEDSYKAIANLYRECTGKELENYKLR